MSARATGSLLWETRESRRTSSSMLVTFPRCLWDSWNTLRMCSRRRFPVPWAEKTSASLRRAVLVMTGNGNLSMSPGHLTMASHCSPTTLLRRPAATAAYASSERTYKDTLSAGPCRPSRLTIILARTFVYFHQSRVGLRTNVATDSS